MISRVKLQNLLPWQLSACLVLLPRWQQFLKIFKNENVRELKEALENLNAQKST